MKAFMDKDFLLETPTAQHLYHDYAETLPIVDYHCHIPPQEIYEDRRFENIAQVWLGGHQVLADGSDYYFGDHYKWRVMRSNGVPEEYITGDKPDRERFQKFAEALEMAIGNPMYTWCHLELKKYFGYNGVLNGDTAEEVWNLCNDKLQHDPKMTVRGLIEQSNVAMVGTTDDPIDSLEWHKKIKEDPTIKVVVAPSFRPDKALNIRKDGFADYIHKLEEVVGRKFACADCVVNALDERLQFFVEMGCRASTHFELCRFGCIDSPQQECYHEIKTGQEKRKANDIESIKSGEFCRDHHCWRRWSLALPPAGYGLDPAHPCDITEGRADG